MIALLFASPIGRGAMIAIAIVLGIVAYTAWQRHDAAQDATRDIKIEAATQEQETRHEGDKAARDAERDGAADRLRGGRF